LPETAVKVNGVNQSLTIANHLGDKPESSPAGGETGRGMSRAKGHSVEELFQQLGETPMLRKARADSLFRRLRETEEDAFRGAFIRSPKPKTPGGKDKS